jgi:hypothetical protein
MTLFFLRVDIPATCVCVMASNRMLHLYLLCFLTAARIRHAGNIPCVQSETKEAWISTRGMMRLVGLSAF